MSQHAAHDFRALRLRARHDNALSSSARLLFEDVCDLAERDGVCVMKPETMALRYGVGTRQVERWKQELREAGYAEAVASPSDRRRKGLRPTWPRAKDGADRDGANPEPQPDGRHKRRANVSAISGMADIPAGEIPDIYATPPRVVIPPGGGAARAREGGRGPADPAGGLEAGGPAGGPTLGEVLDRASMSGVPEHQAREFFHHYDAQGWLTGGRNPQPISNWASKLMGWKLRQPQFDRSDADRAPDAGVRLMTAPQL